MSTQNQTLFGEVMLDEDVADSLPIGYSSQDLFRVQFYSRIQVNGTESIKWHSTVKCNEMYKDIIANDAEISKELSSNHWVCPLVDTISIHNDPATYNSGDGISFNMIVNTCEVAT